MYDLFPSHTLPSDNLVILFAALRASMDGQPEKMKSASITGAIRALGRQLDAAGLGLGWVTVQTDDADSSIGACTGGAEKWLQVV